MYVPSIAKMLSIKRKLIEEDKEKSVCNKKAKPNDDIGTDVEKKEIKLENDITYKFSSPITVFDNKSNLYNNFKSPEEPLQDMVIKDKDIDTEDQIDCKQKHKTILCKTCWIYNNPMCKDCNENDSTNINKLAVENVPFENKNVKLKHSENYNMDTQCKYCWIFNKTRKCYYCGKVNLKTIEINEIPNLKNDSKVVPEVLDENTAINNAEIQRLVKPTKQQADIKSKVRFDWNCELCFTKNEYDRLNCFCCGFNKYICSEEVNFEVNVNFDIENNVFVFGSSKKIDTSVNTIEISSDIIVNSQLDVPTDVIQDDHNNNCLQSTNISNVQNEVSNETGKEEKSLFTNKTSHNMNTIETVNLNNNYVNLLSNDVANYETKSLENPSVLEDVDMLDGTKECEKIIQVEMDTIPSIFSNTNIDEDSLKEPKNTDLINIFPSNTSIISATPNAGFNIGFCPSNNTRNRPFKLRHITRKK